MAKRVLVTGATGFIGKRLVRELLREGYEVRALVREAARGKELAALGAELSSGELDDPESIGRALDGIDGVFHLAAIYGFGVSRDTMRRVNVDGTRHVLDAAARLGTRRIVYVGSDTSLGETHGVVADETKVHDGADESSYEATKREAHELVTARMKAGAPVVCAIVSTVYGPDDPSVIGELIENHLAGRLRATIDLSAGYTFAHVEDVATALRLAYERGRIGDSYLVSGTPATFRDFFAALSSITDIAPPTRELPRVVVPFVLPLLAVLFDKRLGAMRELVAMSRVTRFFSGAKARRELEWKPRSLDEGLRDTVPSFALRERRAAERGVRRSRIALWGLSLFDVGLGAQAALFPASYVASMHATSAVATASTGLVARTGALWLFFAAVELAAAVSLRPVLVFLVGALRLMDVPADLVYFARADDLSALGRVALLGSPVVNVVVGTWLIAAGLRGIRARIA